MAYFAEIDKDNIVIQVLAVDNSQEHRGQEFLADELGLGGTWIQTSYNTIGGQHPENKPLRKNYAGIGFTYDEERDAFIPPKPFKSWNLNEDTCFWEAPTPYPTDGNMYTWDEEKINWVKTEIS